ncbi:MAG: SDR family oxidoreductase [Alphaproteobacteria bacterium]|nr:SDR family oxidoreductase [Alphaproteobacteria bacterium]MBU1277711.1 SDR family oxidoreductase [Alphaproteobacteria bacterium]MBU1574268.1 SDR family oxidoreductase [Alphaproteobacteria bacterium]MBU1827795.1 SDR family oxidoreductase [Alphaproteobacteria bacterium]MBU2077115.1 SDR family oxidoreductase [Alphaproteobacteria bacterium]
MLDLTGKIALVTGASRGIGEATARLFADAGAKVALLARSETDIGRIADEIGEAALAVPCDVASYEDVDAALSKVETTLGPVDILINNAGVIDPIAHLSEADPIAWGQVIDINVKGVFHMMRRVVPLMVARGGGTVLTISSGAAHNPVEAWSAYCTSKAGAAMLTSMLDHEERGHGIRAMGLSPGTVATQMQRDIKASGVNPVSQLDWSVHIPADWPARALLWMCGPEADLHLGQELSLRDDAFRRILGLIT